MKFSVIMADPPWSYRTWTAKGGHKSASAHYATQGIEWIKALPVKQVAADDCALFLWATWPNLPQALEVIAAWGFEYKTLGFDWLKLTASNMPYMGLGYYTRANPEPCLLATRGNPKRVDKGVSCVLEAVEEMLECRVGDHSRKPIEVYSRIDRLMGPDVPKLEMFARPWWGMYDPPCGWTCVGNEITGRSMEIDLRDLANGVELPKEGNPPAEGGLL